MAAEPPLIILGAGATKASGGPMTNEILPELFGKSKKAVLRHDLPVLEDFLVDVFALPKQRAQRTSDRFPGLPLLLSLIDTAIDRKEPLSPAWPVPRLIQLRHAIEYAFYYVLKQSLASLQVNPHEKLLTEIRNLCGAFPTVISLNYDIIIDNTLLQLSGGQFPDFGCDVATNAYRKNKSGTLLLKIHGSLNWLYCAACHRMDVALSEDKRGMVKIFPEVSLEKRFGGTPTSCLTCKAAMESVMITPTYRKDYRNPHISRIWYEAERALREASRVIFIGYSLPEDDVEVIYLLKRGLHRRPAKDITVVEKKSKSGQHELVSRRYRQLFGDKIDWHESGFDRWLATTTRF